MSASRKTGSTGSGREAPPEPSRFMNVREVARYLQVNEKKVYALVSEGSIPATRLTGKWLFPRDLVDQWMLESSHGGLLTGAGLFRNIELRTHGFHIGQPASLR